MGNSEMPEIESPPKFRVAARGNHSCMQPPTTFELPALFSKKYKHQESKTFRFLRKQCYSPTKGIIHSLEPSSDLVNNFIFRRSGRGFRRHFDLLFTIRFTLHHRQQVDNNHCTNEEMRKEGMQPITTRNWRTVMSVKGTAVTRAAFLLESIEITWLKYPRGWQI